MTDQPIPRALSPKEWAEQIAHATQFSRTSGHGEIASHVYASLSSKQDGVTELGPEPDRLEIFWNNASESVLVWDRHKLAALCLYQQPFGFTQEDVKLVRSSCWSTPADPGCQNAAARCPMCSLASRISSLLPQP